MLIRLTNILATIYKIINIQLKEGLDIFYIEYLDNILVYFKTKTEHNTYVKQVLEQLQQARIKIYKEKSEFYVIKLEFLRHIVSIDKIAIDLKKA